MMFDIDYKAIQAIIQDLNLDIDSYCRDGGLSLYSECESMYALMTDAAALRATEKDAIRQAVDALAASLMQRRTIWECLPVELVSGDVVCCTIDGVRVTATVSVSPKRLGVNLLSPVSCESSVMIHDLAPYVYTQEPLEGSPASDDGKARIMDLVMRSYFRERN